MALRKKVEIKTNIDGEEIIVGDYIRVVDYSRDSIQQILLYKNEESRFKGDPHLKCRVNKENIKLPENFFNEDDLKKEGVTPMVMIYNYLKSNHLSELHAQLTDAEDV